MRHNSSIFISFLLCGFHLILNLKTNDSYSFTVQEGWEEWVGISVGEDLKGMCEVLGLIPCSTYMKGRGREELVKLSYAVPLRQIPYPTKLRRKN